MADVTPILINQLAAQTTLSDSDYFIVGGADAKKITVGQMKEALGINELNGKLISKQDNLTFGTYTGNMDNVSMEGLRPNSVCWTTPGNFWKNSYGVVLTFEADQSILLQIGFPYNSNEGIAYRIYANGAWEDLKPL